MESSWMSRCLNCQKGITAEIIIFHDHWNRVLIRVKNQLCVGESKTSSANKFYSSQNYNCSWRSGMDASWKGFIIQMIWLFEKWQRKAILGEFTICIQFLLIPLALSFILGLFIHLSIVWIFGILGLQSNICTKSMWDCDEFASWCFR
jgi:hypothetical protein